MSYYWFNRKELLEKAHKNYHKEGGEEQAASYYQRNKETIKKKAREAYKNLSKEEEEKKENIQEIGTINKTAIQRMNKTLVLNDIEMTKKDFYDAKKAIPLILVDINNCC